MWLQAWADAFRSSPDLTGVVHIYEELKRKGVEFPMADLDALSPIHTPQRVRWKTEVCSENTFIFHRKWSERCSVLLQGTPEVDPAMTKYLAPTSPAPAPKPATSPVSSTQVSNMSGPITATPEQVTLLKSSFIYDWFLPVGLKIGAGLKRITVLYFSSVWNICSVFFPRLPGCVLSWT